MEIIMINDSKIKIMLSAEELASFDLDTSKLDYSNTETKRMFWDILGRAKRSVGFDTDGYRVLVQLYPSRCGGCEMFVTRLSCTKSEKGDKEQTQIEPIINQLPKSPSSRREYEDLYVGAFAFESMDHLIRVCKRLSDIGYDGERDAYIGEDKRSYLFLSNLCECPYLPLDEFSFISEYGTNENEETARSYVYEHAREICKRHAVEQLSRF